MLPSRGVCLACRLNRHSDKLGRLPAQQVPRQFSSISNLSFQRSLRRRLVSTSFTHRPHLPTTLQPGISSISRHGVGSQTRLQSTIPSDIDPAPLTSDYELSSITTAPLAKTWEVGYLSANGIDFGWGPSSMITWIFEHLHNFLGDDVGVSILALALLSRLVTFPLVVIASDQAARFRSIKGEAEVLQALMAKAAKDRDTVRMHQARQALNRLKADRGVQLYKMMFPMIQIPLGFGAWRLLRNASDIGAPGMATGGLLWFQNLTVCDPYFALPMITAIFQHTTIRFGGETGNMSQESQRMRNLLLYVLPGVTAVVTSMAPAAVQLTFAAASGLSLVSNLLLRNATFRNLCGIAPRTWTPPPGSVPQMPVGRKDSVYTGVLTVPNKNMESNRTTSPSAASSGNSALSKFTSKLNPRTWTKGLSGIQDDMAKLSGGRISTIAESKKNAAAKKAKSKMDKLEEKRRIQREMQKREWEKTNGS